MLAVHWRIVSEAGGSFFRDCLDLRATAEPALRDRIFALDAEISDLDHTIAEREAAMNTLVYRLYQLAPEEIAMVEAG